MTTHESLFEYGIHRRKATAEDGPWREGMTREEAETWLDEWVEMGGNPDTFEIIRRERGPWKVV